MKQILENYQQNIDPRGKPLIPDQLLSWKNVLDTILKGVCDSTGFCGFQVKVGPMQYIDYEFA
jgi:hypothetical protein